MNGQKVWEYYLENHKPAAGQIFWVYGSDKNDITVIGLEPHPNDKKMLTKKSLFRLKANHTQIQTSNNQIRTKLSIKLLIKCAGFKVKRLAICGE